MCKKKKILICISVIFLLIVVVLSFMFYRFKTEETISSILMTDQPFEINDDPLIILNGKQDFQNKKYAAAGEYEIQLVTKSFYVKKYSFSVKKYEEPKETTFTCQPGDKIPLSKQKGLSYKFTSSDPESFSVTEEGEVTALKQDAEATITALVNNYREETYTFHSNTVNIKIPNDKLYTGETEPIEINGFTGDINWEIQGNSVILEGNTLTAKTVGKTIFKCNIGGKDYSYEIEVFDDPKIEDLEMIIGQEKEITTTDVIDNSVSFHISDSNIASYEDGKIKALAPGKTTIIGEIHNKEFSASITVYKPAFKENDNKVTSDDDTNRYILKEGEKFSLEVENYGTKLTANSDNENIAIKEIKDGVIVIEGEKEGSSVLTVNADGNELKAIITVYNKNAKITQKEWMQEIKDWCDYMVNDGDWIYSNSNNRKNVDQAIKESHTTNCALMVVHAMQRAGVLTKGHSFYSGNNHEKMGSEESWKEIRKNAEVIDFKNGKTVEEANLQQGDICLWNGHVNIFAGYNKDGKQTWYDAGSKMTIEKVHGGTFANFFKTGNRSKKLYSIIRIHYFPDNNIEK